MLKLMTRDDMKNRTKASANRVVKLCSSLPQNCRAKATPDFINQLRIVEEECDDSLVWMELPVDNRLIAPSRLSNLMREAGEILAIVVASAKTARSTTRS
ncbi:MAG TPA: four helix bundle protein [Verrucomicrobiae bacterium]|nr:four helix bundle protein [Verrucomicrobiae bacterium]